jgi:hypothetical protein
MIEQGQPHAAAHGHEPIEASVRGVYITGAILAGVVIASFLLMLALLGLFSDATGGVPASQFAIPDSLTQRARQLQRLRSSERELLEKYQWVDPAAGIARIPIERAMEIIAEQGFSREVDDPAAAGTPPASEPPAAEGNEP